MDEVHVPDSDHREDALTIEVPSTEQIHERISVIIISLVIPAILCSNITVIASVVKYRRLQIPTNYFLTSLAAADIIVAITLPFYVTTELTLATISNDVICLTVNRILMTSGGVSILTLSVIAYDKFTAILHPLEYVRLMTTRKVFALIVFTWSYSVLLTWAPVIADKYTSVNNSYLCSGTIVYSKVGLVFTGAIFVPSCICILICYFKIFVIARHHSRAITAMENSIRRRIENHFVRSDRKYANTIAIVIGLFIALWLPYQVSLLLDFADSKSVNRWVKHYLLLLAFSNSGVNPWVYAYQNKDFRAAFKKMLESCYCRRWGSQADERRSSVLSHISVIPSSSLARLDRSNSRVIASDILYTLRQHLDKDSMEFVLNRRLSVSQSILTAVGSLPEVIEMFARTYQSQRFLDDHDVDGADVAENNTPDIGERDEDSADSAYSGSEFQSNCV